MLTAADQGHGEAQGMVGRMLAEGRGGPTDYVEAYKWLSLATLNGANELANRDAVASALGDDDLAEARSRVQARLRQPR